MKKICYLLIGLLCGPTFLCAQTAPEILKAYTEATGGQHHWDEVHSMRITGTAKLLNQGGMELPYTRIMLKDGKQLTKLLINGMDYVDTGFDGQVIWGSNSQMEMVEKDRDALENAKCSTRDFPYPGHNWQERGYRAKYLGEAMVENEKGYKVALTKCPQWVDGVQKENTVFVYFSAEHKWPILTESIVLSGPEQGKMMKSYLSDYREVEGRWYPFVVTMKYGDETFQILTADTVEWNAEIEEGLFTP